MSRTRNAAKPVKVVYIETRYVETDATTFKSVVQRLTGKDSVVGVEPGMTGGFSGAAATRAANLSRGVSFKEFNRLLMELPSFDELLSALQ